MLVFRNLPHLPLRNSPSQKFSRSNSRNGILAPEIAPIFEEREKFLQMSVEDKRRQYKSEMYFTVDKIDTWEDYYAKDKSKLKSQFLEMYKNKQLDVDKYNTNTMMNKKVSIWRGNITQLEIDAIVNAANNSLLGGGGVDGAIHAAAGPGLLQECRMLNGCNTGDAKLTGGYQLPSKYVIHTVGPRGENPKMLESCYETCLSIIASEQLRSVAFPCISTGIYGYPAEAAALVALRTVRRFLEANAAKVERIIFCLFLPSDVSLYESLMQLHFPCPE